MIVALILAASLMAQPEPPPPPSPDVAALIAPVREALQAEQAAQSSLPAPVDDRNRIIRMGRLDQSWRQAMANVDLSGLGPDDRRAADYAIYQLGLEADRSNLDALLEMLPADGWFHRSVYGDEAARAAFLIIQHADLATQERFLPTFEQLALIGEVEPRSYAMLYDRVAIRRGRPQRYGSQMTCESGRWVPAPMEMPEQVDDLRASMGMEPLAANIARFEERPC